MCNTQTHITASVVFESYYRERGCCVCETANKPKHVACCMGWRRIVVVWVCMCECQVNHLTQVTQVNQVTKWTKWPSKQSGQVNQVTKWTKESSEPQSASMHSRKPASQYASKQAIKQASQLLSCKVAFQAGPLLACLFYKQPNFSSTLSVA